MHLSRKASALAAGIVFSLAAAAIGQPPRSAPPDDTNFLVLDELQKIIEIEKSNVAALREGVIKQIEMKIGAEVKKGMAIGYLVDEAAVLAVAKAQLTADVKSPLATANAKQQLAETIVANNIRLNKRGSNLVSQEEVRKAEAELAVAEALVDEAKEKTQIDKADLDLAKRVVEEHAIRAPISGVITDAQKHPGESVRAGEPVVHMVNLDRLRVFAYVPLEYAFKIKPGAAVEIQPKITAAGNLPIERKKFVGKVTFIDPTIQAINEVAVRIYADFKNPDHELRPGMPVSMKIDLRNVPAAPTVGARDKLPQLPR